MNGAGCEVFVCVNGKFQKHSTRFCSPGALVFTVVQDVNFNVKQGSVTDIEIYSDCLLPDLVDALRDVLKGEDAWLGQPVTA